ncbi:hypothetical protein LCGC14_1233720 [marine sediment metagenome]|uniref:Uncharacterized protein n=1 Tax=marine sediment metagenome TaxID=412755 RepID=A0A0F9L7T4_9ZZZZ
MTDEADKLRKAAIADEIERCRKDQAAAVMPIIGTLLDAWDGLPGDLRSDPGMEHFSEIIVQINDAMEGHDDG